MYTPSSDEIRAQDHAATYAAKAGGTNPINGKALLDRTTHRAYIIETGSESYRF